MPKPLIIALSGRKGAGKNTVAEYIREHFHGYEIKEYAFADLLKEFCIDVLGLNENQCYGSDDEKNTPTKYKWENTPHFLHSEATFPRKETFAQRGFMTGREVMQVFGTESVRAWFGNVWAEATTRKIQKECPKVAIITDSRFVSEVALVLKQPNAYIIRLTRSPFAEDGHSSETSLDDYNWDKERCFVLDNADLSIDEQNMWISPILDQIILECNL